MMYQEGPMFAGFEGVPELDIDGVARAGEALAPGVPSASEAALIEASSSGADRCLVKLESAMVCSGETCAARRGAVQ